MFLKQAVKAIKLSQSWIEKYHSLICLLVLVFSFSLIATPIEANAVSLIPSKQTICNGTCPIIDSDFDITDKATVANFILGLARFLTYVSGALAVLFIVYGAFLIVTDWGDGKRAGTGWKSIRSSLVGLVIVILAYTAVGLVGSLTSSDLLTQFLVQ